MTEQHPDEPAIFPDRPRVAVPCGAELGEGAIWDGRTGTLLWVDIPAGTLWRWSPGAGGDASSTHVGEPVGFVLLTPDPDAVLVGLRSGLARLDLRGGAPTVLARPEPDRPGNRLNDGTAGPDGSVYFGTMDDAKKERTGRFYRWSPTGLAPFGDEAAITNGPAIDGPAGLLYATDTRNRTVRRHRLGPDGVPGPGEPFVTLGGGDGHPDGMVVDAEGHVWICQYGAGRVTRFTPEGRPVLALHVPTANPTKVAFGGPDLRTLYITTAASGLDRTIDIHAGHVLAVEIGIAGRPADLCTTTG